MIRMCCCPGCCGAPHALIEHVQAGTLAMVSSPALLAELDEVISRAKFDEILARSNTSRERCLAEMRQLAEVIVPPPMPQPVCRDPDDDHVWLKSVGYAEQLSGRVVQRATR